MLPPLREGYLKAVGALCPEELDRLVPQLVWDVEMFSGVSLGTVIPDENLPEHDDPAELFVVIVEAAVRD